MRPLLLVLFILQATGCTHWSRVSTATPVDLPPRRQVQVWHRSGRIELHGVHARGDSLTGIPHWQPLTCDSCRQALAMSDIDSLRSGNHETTGLLLGAAPFVALGLLLIAFSGYGGD